MGTLAIVIIPASLHHRDSKMKVVKSRKGPLELVLLSLTSLGFFLPLVWVATPVLAFADYALRPVPSLQASSASRWGLWFVHRSHADLGANWSITFEVRDKHQLVTQGTYRHVRHPMYLALLLYSSGQALVLPNDDMNVKFTRTAARRYRVSVEGRGVVASWMEPAPGYDARLPHDMAHFVVENELGIAGGIFGQLAGGGHARTFHPMDEQARRKVARRGKRIAVANRGDAMLSERVLYLACQTWNNDDLSAVTPIEGVSADDIRRVCREFDAVSAIWSKLAVGESMTLVWRGSAAQAVRRRQSRR